MGFRGSAKAEVAASELGYFPFRLSSQTQNSDSSRALVSSRICRRPISLPPRETRQAESWFRLSVQYQSATMPNKAVERNGHQLLDFR